MILTNNMLCKKYKNYNVHGKINREIKKEI